MFRVLILGLFVVGLTSCDQLSDPSTSNVLAQLTPTDNPWYATGMEQIAQQNRLTQQIDTRAGAAKNIILFVGDGMSLTTVTAARILEGQQKGFAGEENNLSFDNFPFSGLAKTYAVDAQVPDSASTMTAMATGVKTDNGILALTEDAIRGDCVSSYGNQLTSILDLAEIAGLSTGIVTTARVTHATPAALYAKSPHRNWEGPSQMPQQAIVDGCEDIASQLINYNVNLEARFAGVKTDGIEVVLGGGRRHFLPAPSENSVPELESNHSGKRTDGRNLIAEWQAVYPDGIYVEDSFELNALATEDAKQVLGLFNPSHLRYETDRAAKQASEPSLQTMTAQAIAILDNNPRGFLLVVEAARIDHAHHAGNAYNALSDTIELSKAVKTAVENTDPKDTLIIATADHGHVFTMAGYPKRGNPILGKVVAVDEMEPTLAADNLPYTTLGYAIGRGHRHLGTETNADMAYRSAINAGRKDLRGLDTTQPGFYQEVLIPNKAETHSGEDVPIYAIGPGAHLITGSHEQTVIFHAVNYAAGLSTKARAALR